MCYKPCYQDEDEEPGEIMKALVRLPCVRVPIEDGACTAFPAFSRVMEQMMLDANEQLHRGTSDFVGVTGGFLELVRPGSGTILGDRSKGIWSPYMPVIDRNITSFVKTVEKNSGGNGEFEFFFEFHSDAECSHQGFIDLQLGTAATEAERNRSGSSSPFTRHRLFLKSETMALSDINRRMRESSGSGNTPCFTSSITTPTFSLLAVAVAVIKVRPTDPMFSLSWVHNESSAAATVATTDTSTGSATIGAEKASSGAPSTIDTEEPIIRCPATIQLPAQKGRMDECSSKWGAYIDVAVTSTYDQHEMHHWNGTVVTPPHAEPSVIVATDNWNVSRVLVERDDGVAADEPFAPDARYNVTFRAVDIMGYTAACTSEVSTFTTRKSWKEDKKNMEMLAVAVDAADGMHTYYLEETYKIASPYAALLQNSVSDGTGMPRMASSLFESAADPNKVTFILKWTTWTAGKKTATHNISSSGDGGAWGGEDRHDESSSGPGGWFINPTNGEQGATPEKPGLYTATLFARDVSLAAAVVKVWNVRITQRPDDFKVNSYTHTLSKDAAGQGIDQDAASQLPTTACANESLVQDGCYGVLHTDPASRSLEAWGVGEPIRFAPVQLLDVEEGDTFIDPAQCMFTLQIEPDTQTGVFINPLTGAVLAQHASPTSYNLTVIAVGPDKQEARGKYTAPFNCLHLLWISSHCT